MAYIEIRDSVSSFDIVDRLYGEARDIAEEADNYEILDEFVEFIGDRFEGKLPTMDDIAEFIEQNKDWVLLNRPLYTFDSDSEVREFIRNHFGREIEEIKGFDVQEAMEEA